MDTVAQRDMLRVDLKRGRHRQGWGSDFRNFRRGCYELHISPDLVDALYSSGVCTNETPARTLLGSTWMQEPLGNDMPIKYLFYPYEHSMVNLGMGHDGTLYSLEELIDRVETRLLDMFDFDADGNIFKK